jgi:hypothetical protein
MKWTSKLSVRLAAGVPALQRTVATALCLGVALGAWTPTAWAFGNDCVP